MDDSYCIGARGDDTYHSSAKIDEVQISSVVRSDAWRKFSYYAQQDEVIEFLEVEEPHYEGWLDQWAYRVKIDIDSTNIDSDLTHFPVPIVLTTSAGRLGDDVSHIFDTLGPSSQRIAVTDKDGTSQLYVEIEKWEHREQAGIINKTGVDTTRDLGSSDNGTGGLSTQGSPIDNGTYYTFDGSSDGLYSGSDLGDSSTEVVFATVRIHDKNKGTEQIIWKDGGYTNGVAVGIDASGNLGIFGKND